MALPHLLLIMKHLGKLNIKSNLVTVAITNPETVDAYKNVDDALVFEDLCNGTLMKMSQLVSRENVEGDVSS